MREMDLRDLIYEALTELSAKYNSGEPYQYLERSSFTQIATDLAYELEQRGVGVDAPQEEETTN